MQAAMDRRECAVSGATAGALDAYEEALHAFVTWRAGWPAPLDRALGQAPALVMAHVLRAWAALGGRDPAGPAAAASVLQAVDVLEINDRERLHLAAIRALAEDDDSDRARAALVALLERYPRDLLALHAVHGLDYRTGMLATGTDHAERVLGAWSPALPGHGTVLAIRAFELEERGDYARAEGFAMRALEANPADARAIHAMAHVFEMTERPEPGARWLADAAVRWASDTVVARHCWWHLALLHLAQGDVVHALALYDRRIAPGAQGDVAALIDSAALLWRVALSGGECGPRWQALAQAWAPHVADGYCSFSDVHAMLAFVGAGDWRLALALERELERRQWLRTRHGETTRTIGLPACRALIAFGRGRYADAVHAFAYLPPLAYRLGGSHAQRDVLNLTLLAAVERMRREARRPLLAA